MDIQLNDTMALPSGKERSSFDTAIPGQSDKLISLVDAQIPIATIVDSLLLAGFSEGLMTPDTAILVGEDLTMLIMHLSEQAGVDYKVIKNQDSMIDKGLQQIAQFKKDKGDFEAESVKGFSDRMKEDNTEELPMEQPQGLMAKQGAM